jgi:VWFA-related protein
MRARTLSQTLTAAVAAGLMLGGSGTPSAQTPAGQQPPAPPGAAQQQPQREVIRRAFDLIRADVIVRDPNGQFIADLKKDEFEVYEDDVKQDIVSFLLTHGGRTYNQTAPPPVTMEGIVLPQAKPSNDAAGRIFLLFVDDLHLDFNNTSRIRDLFKRISKELIHDGDLFGIVSTGPSSIAIDLTYDRKRLDEAISKIAGNGLKPKEIVEAPLGADGPPEIKYRAHVAFSTAYDLLKTLEQVHDRRKSFIFVSNGYDFNPFPKTRDKVEAEKWARPNKDDPTQSDVNPDDGVNPFLKRGTTFAEADLVSEIAELTREANRANTSFYTIDPRGLVGGPDLDQDVDVMEWQDHVLTTQNTLRVLAEQTGGFAIVNSNNFDKGLKRIDAETSDYYVIGYFSSNPDPLKKTRKIDVRVKRKGLEVRNLRQTYTLKPPQGPTSSSK